MNRPLRVLVTGAGGQVGVDLVDILGATTPLGASTTFSPDGRDIDDDEFEILALTHHDLDITDRDRVVAAVERVDVVMAVDPDRGAIAEHDLVRDLRPVLVDLENPVAAAEPLRHGYPRRNCVAPRS